MPEEIRTLAVVTAMWRWLRDGDPGLDTGPVRELVATPTTVREHLAAALAGARP